MEAGLLCSLEALPSALGTLGSGVGVGGMRMSEPQ